MAKRPDSLETLQLSHELLRRIPKGRTITAPELHQQLMEAGYEREMRTIQRQLETLSEFYDIERDDSSKPYRYRWKENAKGLSLPGLSAQESLLLVKFRAIMYPVAAGRSFGREPYCKLS